MVLTSPGMDGAPKALGIAHCETDRAKVSRIPCANAGAAGDFPLVPVMEGDGRGHGLPEYCGLAWISIILD